MSNENTSSPLDNVVKFLENELEQRQDSYFAATHRYIRSVSLALAEAKALADKLRGAAPPTFVPFNDREIATILHALRTLQCEGRIEGCAAGDCDHFDEAAQLTNGEIDDLCERINFDNTGVQVKQPSSSSKWPTIKSKRSDTYKLPPGGNPISPDSAKAYIDGQQAPWCDACQSYHLPENPTCKARNKNQTCACCGGEFSGAMDCACGERDPLPNLWPAQNAELSDSPAFLRNEDSSHQSSVLRSLLHFIATDLGIPDKDKQEHPVSITRAIRAAIRSLSEKPGERQHVFESYCWCGERHSPQSSKAE